MLCRHSSDGERPLRAGLAMWRALCVGFLPIVAVTGQVTLEQLPREVTLQEGDEFTFHCSMKEGDMSSYYMHWYRQGLQGSLELIYKEGDKYGEGFQDHFNGTVESSQNSFTLQILAAQQGDAATYYCGADRWAGYHNDINSMGTCTKT